MKRERCFTIFQKRNKILCVGFKCTKIKLEKEIKVTEILETVRNSLLSMQAKTSCYWAEESYPLCLVSLLLFETRNLEEHGRNKETK